MGETAYGLPPDNVKNLRIINGDGTLILKWEDPPDTIVEGQLLSTWAGTKVVGKAGGYPTDVNDGTLYCDNTERNSYSEAGLEISGLQNEVAYYFQLFPYNDHGAVNKSVENRRASIPYPYRIFGVDIDTTNSNPETSVTYTDDAVGMPPGSADWFLQNIYRKIRPCLLKAGKVVGYLNPDDYTKFVDGTAADITSGEAGDVMIEIPKTGYSIVTEGDIIHVRITDNPNNPEMCYYAHTRDEEGDREYLYVGAYLAGPYINNCVRSLSGKKPVVESYPSGNEQRVKCAQNNGAGYDLLGFYPLTLVQCLYLIFFKNLDSQTALGKGNVQGSTFPLTGELNSKGMNFGSQEKTSRVKLLGIEDIWGSAGYTICGIWLTGPSIRVAFNDYANLNNYTEKGQAEMVSGTIFCKKVFGNNNLGFVISDINKGGSSTTYFCDLGGYTAHNGWGSIGFCSLNGDTSGAEGVFAFDFRTSRSSGTIAATGARLMYL